MTLNNGDLAELLSRESEAADTDRRKRALRRASHSALWRWSQEAAAIRERGGRFTELVSVGSWIEHFIDAWFDDDTAPPEHPPIRRGFLTLSEARETFAANPEWMRAYRGVRAVADAGGRVAITRTRTARRSSRSSSSVWPRRLARASTWIAS